MTRSESRQQQPEKGLARSFSQLNSVRPRESAPVGKDEMRFRPRREARRAGPDHREACRHLKLGRARLLLRPGWRLATGSAEFLFLVENRRLPQTEVIDGAASIILFFSLIPTTLSGRGGRARGEARLEARPPKGLARGGGGDYCEPLPLGPHGMRRCSGSD